MESIKDTFKDVNFLPFQEKAIKHFAVNNCLFAVHNTGAGKTLTALASSEIFLRANPLHNVIVISPASLIRNFHKENKKHKLGIKLDTRYFFYSYRKLPNIVDLDEIQEIIHNSMVIFDEVHNIRNIKTKSSSSAFNLVKNCKKVLLLTATPFVNYLGDFKIYVRLLYKNDSFDKSISQKPTINTTRYNKDIRTITKYLRRKVSFYYEKNTEDFPECIEQEVNVPMNNDYYEKYLLSLKKVGVFGDNPEVFYHGYRRVVNSAGIDDYYSAKVLKFIELYNQLKSQTLIFTNWLDFGIAIIKDILEQHEVTYEVIDGSVSPKRRLEIVEEYNHKIFNVLLITRAGYEGLDLKETGIIIVLDPVWNLAGYYQIMGRGIRYKSHENLPKEERKVYVYKMILVPPEETEEILEIDMKILGAPFTPRISGDQILYSIMEQKRAIHDNVFELLKETTI